MPPIWTRACPLPERSDVDPPLSSPRACLHTALIALGSNGISVFRAFAEFCPLCSMAFWDGVPGGGRVGEGSNPSELVRKQTRPMSDATSCSRIMVTSEERRGAHVLNPLHNFGRVLVCWACVEHLFGLIPHP